MDYDIGVLGKETLYIKETYDNLISGGLGVSEFWNAIAPHVSKLIGVYRNSLDIKELDLINNLLIKLSYGESISRESSGNVTMADEYRIFVKAAGELVQVLQSLVDQPSPKNEGTILRGLTKSDKKNIFLFDGKSYFVGRRNYIDKIKCTLKESGSRISITGIEGIGKTQLAFKILRESLDDNILDTIIQLYFRRLSTLDSLQSEFMFQLFSNKKKLHEVQKLGPEECKIAIKKELANRKKILVLADNYETVSGPLNRRIADRNNDDNSTNNDKSIQLDIKKEKDREKELTLIHEFIDGLPSNVSVLATSRERINQLAAEQVIELEGLTIEEGTQLFATIMSTDSKTGASEIIKKATQQIVAKLQGHPLSIELYGKSYQEMGYTELEDILRDRKVKLLPMTAVEYAYNNLDHDLKERLQKLMIFHSPFLVEGTRQIFDIKTTDIALIYNRSLLEKIFRTDENGIEEPDDYWLYDFHPIVRQYLEYIVKQKQRNQDPKLETENGQEFSDYYYNLLIDTYNSIGKDNEVFAIDRFNTIFYGLDNDFDRAGNLSIDAYTQSSIYSYLGLITDYLGRWKLSLRYHKKALGIDKDLVNKPGLAADLVNIGTVYQYQGNLSKALHYHKRALLIHEELADKPGLVKDYTNIGLVLQDLGKLDESLKYLEKALRLDEELGDRVGLAVGHRTIGNILREKGSLLQALDHHNAALKIDEELGDKIGLSADYTNLGVVYQDQSNLSKALDYHNAALKIDEELGDKLGLATDYTNIGVVYQYQGNLSQSLEYHNRALSIHEELGDKPGLARDYTNIGLVLQDLGKLDESLKYLEKALRLDEELGDKVMLARDYTNIGLVFRYQGKLSQALDYHNRALSIHKELGDKVELAIDYANLGSVLQYQGNLSQSLEYHNRALSIHEVLGDKPGLARDYTNIGLVLQDLGKLEESLAYHRKTLSIHEELGDKVELAIDYTNLGSVLQDLGKLEESLAYHEKALRLDEELKNKPGQVSDYINIGLINDLFGQHKNAISYYDKALSLQPCNVTALDNKGYAFSNLSMYDEAIKWSLRAIKEDPNYANGWYNLASYNIRAGNKQEGLEYLKKAILLQSNEYKQTARNDKDFESVRNDEHFKEIIA